MTSYRKVYYKLNQMQFMTGARGHSGTHAVSMDQNTKDTRNKLDHKCILIRNPNL